MKSRKKTAFTLFLAILIYTVDVTAFDAMGVKASKVLLDGGSAIADKNIPIILKASQEVGVEVGKMLLKTSQNLDGTVKTVLPVIDKASADLGKNFALGTVLFLGEKAGEAGAAISAAAAKVAAAVKTGTTIVIASPATPYIVVGVSVAGGGYIVYKVYRSYNPTTGEQIIKAEEKAQLYKAKTSVKKAKTEYYGAKVEEAEAKKEMMAKMAAQMAPVAA